MTYIPTSFRVTFTLDTDQGRYVVDECAPGFTRVPRELIAEDRRFNDDIHANLILRGGSTEKKDGGIKGRKTTFFTGLQETAHAAVYIGNVLTFGRNSERVRNGILVRFSTDRNGGPAGLMTVLYFPAYFPYPDQRAAFVAAVVGRGLL